MTDLSPSFRNPRSSHLPPPTRGFFAKTHPRESFFRSKHQPELAPIAPPIPHLVLGFLLCAAARRACAGVLLAPTTFLGVPGWRLAFLIVALVSAVLATLTWLLASDPRPAGGLKALASAAEELVREAQDVVRVPTFQIIVDIAVSTTICCITYSFRPAARKPWRRRPKNSSGRPRTWCGCRRSRSSWISPCRPPSAASPTPCCTALTSYQDCDREVVAVPTATAADGIYQT